jgi:atypical dual specificity phosphatase
MARLENFSYLIEGKIAASAHPGRGPLLARSLADIRREGIGAILTLCEDPLDEAMLREFELASLHLPVRDFTAPTIEQIESAVAFLDETSARESKALVHCAVGYGRTGTILACYLVWRGATATEAIERVRLLRPGSIEDISQEKAVFAYERLLIERSDGARADPDA